MLKALYQSCKQSENKDGFSSLTLKKCYQSFYYARIQYWIYLVQRDTHSFCRNPYKLFNTHLFFLFLNCEWLFVHWSEYVQYVLRRFSCLATLIMIRLELKLTTTAVKSYSCFPLRPSFIYLTFFEKEKNRKMIVLTKNKNMDQMCFRFAHFVFRCLH